MLQQGKSIALVSDAGTPLISDPGFDLVREARAAGIPVIAVPGPCAAVAALSICGLPTDSFVFVGFLPPKSAARRKRLQALAGGPRTLIFYEAAHRIVESIADFVAVLGPVRRVFLAREISKRFEQSFLGAADELLRWIGEDENRQRGEFVLIAQGVGAGAPDSAEGQRVLELLLCELPAARAVKLAAEITGLPRNTLYDLALELAKHKQQ